jgi:antitoxin component YwqK of YwqJK toxin-antitoxin module
MDYQQSLESLSMTRSLMKIKFYFILGILGVLFSGCQKSNQEDNVISQKYIHKYGYAVSKEEWDEKHYPGQAISTLRNGVTITATYENGVLHGPCTHTYPHSQTVESYFLYNQGNLVKEILYDIKGMPVREKVQLSPSRYSMTLWYADGTPMSVEEYAHDELLEGQYFTMNNEIEARVEKGNGKRIRRDQQGLLLSVDQIERGYLVKRESFHANGAPESTITFSKGQLHGEKRAFASNGEPIVIEEWINGKLHGKCTYFKNGSKTLEVSFLYGKKNGIETHFVDGVAISQEIHWENDKKHGPSIYYIDGIAQTEYYYNGNKISKKTYDENLRLDEMISQISPELRVSNPR